MAIPIIFTEVYRIFTNAPAYALILESALLISVVWLVFYKRNGSRKKYTPEEEEDIIANYTPEPLITEVSEDHQALKAKIVNGRVGKRITIDGNECLNLATHNYLGLMEDPEILEEAIKSLNKYGVGSCGPRGFYGTVDVHLDLEDKLSNFMGTEEAVVYSYGFSTIASAIPAYSKRNDIIFADEGVNFAIQKGIDASRSTVHYFKHNDMADLERLLKEQKSRNEKNPKKAAKTRRFLIAEGIYMNTGEICPLPELVALRKKYELRLFLDESVSFGAIGKTGRGLTEYYNVNLNEVDLICGSMEWAIASVGGFCVGSHFIVEHQRLSGLGYCFSASLPPLLTQAAITALDRFESHPEMFAELEICSKKLHAALSKLSNFELHGHEISPVKHLYVKKSSLTPEEQRLILQQVVDKCIEKGLAVIDAKYLDDMEKNHPLPSLRITSNRLLTDKDIDLTFDILESTSKLVC